MTIRWQLDEFDQHNLVSGEILKEDSEPWEDQAPHYARRRVRSFPTFPLFPPQPYHGAMLGPISG